MMLYFTIAPDPNDENRWLLRYSDGSARVAAETEVMLWLLLHPEESQKDVVNSGITLPINVNTATAKELESLKGIGKKTALAIVKERASLPFSSPQDFIDRFRVDDPSVVIEQIVV